MIPEYMRPPPPSTAHKHLSNHQHLHTNSHSLHHPLQPDPYVYAPSTATFHNPYLPRQQQHHLPQQLMLQNPQQLQQQNSYYIATPHYTHVNNQKNPYQLHATSSTGATPGQLPLRHDSISSTSSTSSTTSTTTNSATSSNSSSTTGSPTHQLHSQHYQHHHLQSHLHIPTPAIPSTPLSAQQQQQQQHSKKRRGNLPKQVTDILRSWLNEHVQHPYPTDEEKADLMKQTGLTLNQISNWFINARRRRLPAMHRKQVT